MLAAGVPAKVVQETLGHSTVGLRLDTYTNVYTEVAAEAAEGPAGGGRHWCSHTANTLGLG
jgi:hypothetical protein